MAVVPTLGERVDTLGPALASLRAEEGLCTLVVVAPVEAEEARRVANEHGAIVVDDPRRGLSAAVNAGVGAADGEEFFAWIGDDDAFRPGGLTTLIELLERETEAVVAFGACEYMDDTDRVFGVSGVGDWATRILGWGPDLIPQPASLTRLDHMRSVGPYDESLRFVMDLDMFLRLRRRGPFLSTKRVVAAYRWHPDALTVANRGASVAEAEMVKRRYLPSWLASVAPMWEVPVRAAINVVSRQLSRRARRQAVRA